MIIMPMSYFGLPFEKTKETWNLFFPRYRIELHVTEFQVPCQGAEGGKAFTSYHICF
jgi:hypothetical protein